MEKLLSIIMDFDNECVDVCICINEFTMQDEGITIGKMNDNTLLCMFKIYFQKGKEYSILLNLNFY